MFFKITWLGQAGYVLKIMDTSICIDPYLSNSGEKKEGVKRLMPIPISPEMLNVDYLITTHDHLDHFDHETISAVKMADTTFAGPSSCITELLHINKKCKDIISLDRGNSIKTDDFVLQAVYSDHTEDSIGIVISESCDFTKSIYFTGDSLFNEDLYNIKRYNPVIMFGCINGKWGNMTYLELASLAKNLEVKRVIPNHYGMFAENTEDPKKLEEVLKEYDIDYQELELGKEIVMTI